MLPVSAQREGSPLEPQAGVSDLLRIRAEFADQTEEANGACQARTTDRAGYDEPSLVDGFYA